MAPSLDLTGQKFSMITVLEFSHTNKKAYWRCRCECGNELVVRGENLRSGNTKSCGCQYSNRLLFEPGQRFGSLTVVSCAGPNERRMTMWLCRCDCGELRKVRSSNLKFGITISCKTCTQAGLAEKRKTHGFSRKANRGKGYYIWISMIQRCQNPKDISYANYGGRGIKVCERWLKFENFIADITAEIGPRPSLKHTIDRIDNERGHYEPGNVRWSTAKEQGNNRRNNLLITHNGKTQTLSQWADELGISSEGLSGRLKKGWSIQEAVETPVIMTGGRASGGARNLIVYDGRAQFLTQWARELGMPHSTLDQRISRGWSVKEAFETPARTQYLTHNGKTQNISQWARELGVRTGLLSQRLRSGWSTEDILKRPAKLASNLFTYRDRTQNVSQWAREIGISARTLQQRLQNGWSIEAALETPPATMGARARRVAKLAAQQGAPNAQ